MVLNPRIFVDLHTEYCVKMKRLLLLLPLILLMTMCKSADEPLSESIDVLYFVSTNILSARDSANNIVWQSTLSADDSSAMAEEMQWVKQNMFNAPFNLTTPFYHQFSFESLQLQPDSFNVVYSKVADEACRIFDDFMAHRDPNRPFILAGFSQGAMLTLDILRHMTDGQFQKMVACYAIGYRLTAFDTLHPHIRPARGETDRGVVISFNSTQTMEGCWDFVSGGACTCINPVNWCTDTTSATFTYDGNTQHVHVDPENNVLIVRTNHPEYYHAWMDAATFFTEAGVSRNNLHHWDLLFYSRFIHDNALRRTLHK